MHNIIPDRRQPRTNESTNADHLLRKDAFDCQADEGGVIHHENIPI